MWTWGDMTRLAELERSYARMRLQHSLWASWWPGEDFRAPPHYLSADRDLESLAHYAARRVDWALLLKVLVEDGAFGAATARVAGRLWSRDLIDSVAEIAFLQRAGAPLTEVLDIGAGYGRLAHRLCTAVPTARVTCVDPIAVSTFLCEKYLEYRAGETGGRARALDATEPLEAGRYTLACNIHSWSECPLEEVRRWLTILDAAEVSYLFVRPHTAGFLTWEPDGARGTFRFLLDVLGYEVVAYDDSYPQDVSPLYLFKR